MDRRRDRRTVPNPIDRIIRLGRVGFPRADCRTRQVRMLGVNATVENCDRDATPATIGEGRIAQPIPHDQWTICSRVAKSSANDE